ncbi:MAG: mechanosensitive ion channel domain-containing protein [Defluviicoccus sp.]
MDMITDLQPLADSVAGVRAWLARELSSPSIIAQTTAIAAAGGLAMLLAPRLQRWIRTWHRRVDSESRLGQSANAFVRRLTLALTPLIAPFVALLLLWPALLAAQHAGWPHQAIRLVVSLLAAWVLIRLTSSLVRERFWSRAIAVVVWAIAALNIFGVLDDTATFLQGLSWSVGGLRISPMAIVTGLVWLGLLLWLATWMARVLESRVLSRSGATPSLQLLTARLLKVVLIIAAIFIALGTIGIDLTAFAVFTGALGVGIGFGLQAIFNNLVAGLILLSEKSLKVGDFVDLERGHLAGTVRQINIRNTIITTPDSIDVAVPNSEFVNGRVTNWTMLDAHARIHVPFGVAYGTDLELVRQAVCESADQVKFTLKDDSGRVPQLWLVNFAESRLEFELVVWLTSEGIHRPLGARAAYCWAIYQSLRKYGIEVPFAQRDLHVRTSVPLRVDLSDGGRKTSRRPAKPPAADRPEV